MKITKPILLFLAAITLFQFTNAQTAVQQAVQQAVTTGGIGNPQIEAALSGVGEGFTDNFDFGGQDLDLFENEDREVDESDDDDNYRRMDNFTSGGQVFGRDIFRSSRLTFTPNYNMPTPKDYVLAAGDEIIIEIWGQSEFNTKAKISTEGTINISRVGLIYLNGLTIEEAENRIKKSLSQIMSNIDSEDSEVKVSLGQIRSIKINMVGEVAVPGTYTLPSLATLFNAMYSAGGVNAIGSLRDIKVYRSSRQIASLDVYDYLINGNYETNIRLEDNDMIIIQPYDKLVKISGYVKRPRIYELKNGETLAKLIEYAGDFRGDAYTDNIRIRRKSGVQYEILTVGADELESVIMEDGDEVYVDKIIEAYANRVSIRGAVLRPGEYEYSDKMYTLSQLIEKAEGLLGNEFSSRGQITRLKPDLTYEIIPFDVLSIATGTSDISLRPEDYIYIPTIFDMREDYTVSVKGEVNHPLTLPYRDNLTIEDVIMMSGGLKESASTSKIEVVRRIKDPRSINYSEEIAETFTFSIFEDLGLSEDANKFILQPFDIVYVRRSPAYNAQQSVYINGEILFGGEYVLSRASERITELVKGAGGPTPEAYIKGAHLKRKMTDEERIRMETILKVAQKNTGNGTDSISIQSLDISEYYPVGIDLEKILKNSGSDEDLILREGDMLFIPKMNSTVKISGAVLYSNTVAFMPKKNINEYISQAGGYALNAKKRPFIIYMNGTVTSTRKGFLHKKYPKVEPGCEIVVPTKQIKNNNVGFAEVLELTLSATSTAAVIANLLK
ncbi:MAG: SLBB domain-containing protein [Rikenellaceae bacterium]|nr:SLBB domain-containing protein [Rikenellaceae bacterium]